jgi:hypothetical protein
LGVLVLAGGLLAGCASPSSAEPSHELHMAPLHEMPMDVQEAPVRVQEAYQFAVANPEVVKELPCYCGCGPIGHKNNYDCYVSGGDPASGVVAYDAHALGCQICVDITQDAMRLLQEGETVAQVKWYVDRNYARYGPSNMP